MIVNSLREIKAILERVKGKLPLLGITHYNEWVIDSYIRDLDDAIKRYEAEAARQARHRARR